MSGRLDIGVGFEVTLNETEFSKVVEYLEELEEIKLNQYKNLKKFINDLVGVNEVGENGEASDVLT